MIDYPCTLLTMDSIANHRKIDYCDESVQLTEFNGLLYVNGEICPEGFVFTRCISFKKIKLRELPDNLIFKGFVEFTSTDLTKLPNGMTMIVRGFIDVSDTKIPDEINDSLNLPQKWYYHQAKNEKTGRYIRYFNPHPT